VTEHATVVLGVHACEGECVELRVQVGEFMKSRSDENNWGHSSQFPVEAGVRIHVCVCVCAVCASRYVCTCVHIMQLFADFRDT
jgi:hypothetical protein